MRTRSYSSQRHLGPGSCTGHYNKSDRITARVPGFGIHRNHAGKCVRSIDPRYFRAFKAVAEAGTFSEAAGLAAMTQANISKHIKALEDQLSSVLFLRTPQGAVITEVGLRLRDYIRHVEVLESRFMSEIRHHSM